MGDGELIPWAERAIGKEEVALLLGCEPRGVLERHACRAGFPQRIQDKPAMWIAKEVVAWRDTWMRRRRDERAMRLLRKVHDTRFARVFVGNGALF